MSDDRLITIETKLAHQELIIEELNAVIAQQQEAIDQMQKALKILVKRKDQEEDIGPANQKPPHW